MSEYNPTPAEITEACREIQSEWTEAERLRRLRADWRPEWRVPEVRTSNDHKDQSE